MSAFLKEEALYQQGKEILAKLGYDLSHITTQHIERVRAFEQSQPSVLDEKYSITTPPSWISHFSDGVPLFGCSTIRKGGQYKLSAGQRQVLRDSAGLTPTRTITVIDMEYYPKSTAVRTLTIESNLHVSEDRRKHVLKSWTITAFGDFMQRCADAEVTIAAVKVSERSETELLAKPTALVKPIKTAQEIFNEYL